MRMDGLYSALQNPTANKPRPETAQPAQYRKVLHMVENERMGGKVPVWKTERVDKIAGTSKGFETALNYALNGDDAQISDAAIALNPAENHAAAIDDKPFGFSDLVDMANPLHHIPVVNYAYRGITGDQIRPISQIVGGAIFGGPVGAASGVINVAIKEETGKDLGEHAVNAFSSRTASHTVNRIKDLPTSLLAYTAPDLPRTQSMHKAKAPHTESTKPEPYPNLEKTPTYREPITELLLNMQSKSF